jgi:hypothetical protein
LDGPFIIVSCRIQGYEENHRPNCPDENTDPLKAIFVDGEDPDLKWFQFFDEKEVMHISVFINHPLECSTDMGALPPLERLTDFRWRCVETLGGLVGLPIISYLRQRQGVHTSRRGGQEATSPERFGLEDGPIKTNAYADILSLIWTKSR